jgi:hypothetical protein
MFREFAKFVAPPSLAASSGTPPLGADLIFQLHPADLVGLLEVAWDRRQARGRLGSPTRRSDFASLEHTFLWGGALASTPPSTSSPFQPNIGPILTSLRGSTGVQHDHLIYAYMIENTRIKSIMQKVVSEFLHGEKLGPPSTATQGWLRTTEQLFFRDPPPFFVTSVHSDIRPDADATRRNAYQRMFGMDLNHGTADNKPYPYTRAETANKEFAGTFEELLREVWVGIIHVTNTSGTKPTDDNKLLDLVAKLEEMLIARRINGNLSREEFTFVCMMSWFHMTVEQDTQVVVDLKAQATNEEQRLFKIAQLVGAPAHGLSGSYFELADEISRVLLLIESGFFAANPTAIVGFYTPGNPLEEAMRTIITHWSVISGRDIKSGKVAPPDAVRRSA